MKSSLIPLVQLKLHIFHVIFLPKVNIYFPTNFLVDAQLADILHYDANASPSSHDIGHRNASSVLPAFVLRKQSYSNDVFEYAVCKMSLILSRHQCALMNVLNAD